MAEPCTKDYGSDPNQSFGLQRVYKLQSQLREKSIFQSDHDTAMKTRLCVCEWHTEKLHENEDLKMSTTRPRRALFVAMSWLTQMSLSYMSLGKIEGGWTA